MILVCLMEKQEFIKGKIAPIYQHSTVYFQTKTYTLLPKTAVIFRRKVFTRGLTIIKIS